MIPSREKLKDNFFLGTLPSMPICRTTDQGETYVRAASTAMTTILPLPHNFVQHDHERKPKDERMELTCTSHSTHALPPNRARGNFRESSAPRALAASLRAPERAPEGAAGYPHPEACLTPGSVARGVHQRTTMMVKEEYFP